MKYYSETLKRTYDSEKECLKAEEEYSRALAEKEAKAKELSETRKARAKEVEDAYKAAADANNKYIELRNAFLRDYHSFHMTITDPAPSLLSFLLNL